MKKLLAILIAMLLCVTAVFGLASCGDDEGEVTTPDPVVITAEDAIKQIDVLYGRDAKETSEDYNLMGIIKVETTEFNVDWTLACEDETVTIEKVEVFVKDAEGNDTEEVEYRYYTVKVPHVAKDATIAYTITASIAKGEGEEPATVSFSRTVVHGHVYADATCQVLATCDCGETTGELAACVDADENYKCDVCGETVDHEHVWADATCAAPKTCLCGATEGEKLPCVDEDKNYICDECEASILTGAGTDADAYVLPYAGAGVCAFPGGYNPIWYTYTATEDGYITVSSTLESAWLQIGADIYTAGANSNSGNGQPVKYLAKAGDTVVIGIADWDEKVCDVDFAIAIESVEFKDTAFLVGNWAGTETAMWGKQNTVFVINADGTGTGYYTDAWDETTNFDITAVYYIGDDIIINAITTGMWGGQNYNLTFVYAETEENGKSLTTQSGMMGVELVLTPFEGEPDFGDEDEGNADYNTVATEGYNTLYFSAEEVAANTADRTVVITVAGEYKFRASALWVKSIVDANGNVIAKNDNYNYILEAGEYTITFGNLSMFGVQADVAQELNVELQAAAEPEEPETPDEPETPVVPDTPTTGGSGTSSDPYVIGSLPFNVSFESAHDLYYTFTADKDMVIVIHYTSGAYVSDLPGYEKDSVNLTYTATLTAGQTIKINLWATTPKAYSYTIESQEITQPETPDTPEGGEGEEGGETSSAVTYISEKHASGRFLKVVIDAAAGKMTLIRSDMTGNFTTASVLTAEYSYVANGANSTATVLSGQSCTIVFGEDGIPTAITWGSAQFINFAVEA